MDGKTGRQWKTVEERLARNEEGSDGPRRTTAFSHRQARPERARSVEEVEEEVERSDGGMGGRDGE
jgi:hypothetical protein